MNLISPTLDPILFAFLAVATPFVSYTTSRLVDRCMWWRERPKAEQRREGTFRTVLGVVLALHTLYIFYVLVFAKPPNLFTALGVPVSLKQSQLRKTIAQHADAPPFPITPSFDLLLTRLASFDVRVLFLRFGQDALQTCAHCHTHSDFMQYAFPRPLLAYLREAAVVGVLTLQGSRRERARAHALGLLIFAMQIEAYIVAEMPIQIGIPTAEPPMLHDLSWTLRNLLFLLLPLAIHFLPPTPTTGPTPPESLADALTDATAAHERAQLLHTTRAAVMRAPALRRRADAFWSEGARKGRVMRESRGVRDAAARVGLDYEKMGPKSYREAVTKEMWELLLQTPIGQEWVDEQQ